MHQNDGGAITKTWIVVEAKLSPIWLFFLKQQLQCASNNVDQLLLIRDNFCGNLDQVLQVCDGNIL